MVVTIQVHLDPLDDKVFTKTELDVMEGEMNKLCHNLEKYSYIRAQIFIDDKVRGS